MDIDLLPDPRDYEIYFSQVLSKTKQKKESNEISEINGAFDRIAVSLNVDPFDSSKFTEFYPKWGEILSEFSLLFYGLGSKYELLHDFGEHYLSKFGYVIEIDGFSEQSRISQLAINSLCDMESVSHSITELEKSLKESKRIITFIIHSLDSSIIDDQESRNILIFAARSKWFKVIASFDRIPLLSLSFLTELNFYPIMVKTERQYTHEIGFSKSTKSSSSNDSIERYVGVLKTLTNVANGIFKVLLKHQIKNGIGLTRNEWCEKATSELCVKLNTAFAMQINEFLDHRLISDKNNDTYYIPLNNLQLETLLSKLEKES